MPRIHLYKLSAKESYTLFSPHHPFFVEERMVRYQKIYQGEDAEIVLHVGKKEEVEFLFSLPPDFLTITEESSALSITPRKTSQEIVEYLKKGILDTLYKEDALLVNEERQRQIFYHYGRFRMRGFYGILHRLFPIVFIMHGIAGFQPMTWDMIIGDPYFEDRNYLEILKHYQVIEAGLEEILDNLSLRVVENIALRTLNELVHEEEGFNKAARLCTKLGLGFLKDFYWPATQATEHSEWHRFLRPPIPLFPWKEESHEKKNTL
ncbi:MAG: hypothetical protein HPY68_01720 [Candidatus Atribacteria bacterium]|nr:hypothetical protein [Candidatus Atribacteria bacterium]